MPPRSLNGSGHFLATDGELAERVESLSLETAASITRKSSLSQRMGSLQSMPSSVAESILPVSDNGRTGGVDDESAVEARNAVRELPAVSTSTGKKPGGQMRSPSWEEKGKVSASLEIARLVFVCQLCPHHLMQPRGPFRILLHGDDDAAKPLSRY